MRACVFLLISMFLWIAAEGQYSLNNPSSLVAKSKLDGETFPAYELLSPVSQQKTNAKLAADLNAYELFGIQAQAIRKLNEASPKSLTFNLPTKEGVLSLKLVKVDLLTDDFKITLSSGEPVKPDFKGLHYRGVIEGQKGSIVALSVYQDHMAGMISDPTDGNLQLEQLNDNPEHQHILYRPEDLVREDNFDCETSDEGPDYTMEELDGVSARKSDGKCVGVFFEIDNDIFRDKGGSTGVTNYITGLFNQVATIYANENVTVKISELFIWDTPSPYTASTSSGLLNQFQSYRTSINGDLGQLLSYKASGGIAVVNGLCRSSTSLKLSFSSIGSSYAAFPNYSFTIMVVAHEFGHLMGSYHTHSCVWNGNNTALDNCPGFTEGGCASNGVPSGGGTIMSYCHLNAVGINFTKGFGDQPGNVIRSRVAASSCLQTCDTDNPDGGGDGNDGGGNNDCADNELNLSIRLDNYGSEITWQVKDDGGQVVASGGPYSDGALGTVVNEAICLPNGCYKLVMLDAYGDGICCAYGSGSYELTDDEGRSLASGASYDTEEQTDFCLNDQPNQDCNGRYVIMALTLDNFGEETTWEITGPTGSVLFNGGPYDNKMGGEIMRDTFCLPDGCSMFKIMDADDDGICCDYGNGAVELKFDDGEVIMNAANFDSMLEKEICVNDDGGGGDGGEDCVLINFNDFPVQSYGGSQDKGSFDVQDDGITLKIEDNAWKAVDVNYTITANTILEFDFKSTVQGEIMGIGMDDDNGISSAFAFKLYGTQNWGILDYDDYESSDDWKTYRIPIGQYYTGDATKIFFMGDHDGGRQNGNAFYRNVRIHEGTDCLGLPATTGELPAGMPGVTPSQEHTQDLNHIQLFPNPANTHLNLKFGSATAGEAILEIYALTGQLMDRRKVIVTKGTNKLNLDISALNSGAFILNINSNGTRLVNRFQVIKD